MKDPERLSAAGGPLAEALAAARRRAPDEARLAALSGALASHGIHVQPAPNPSSALGNGTSHAAQTAAGKAGLSVTAKALLGAGAVVAVGLALGLTLGLPHSVRPDSAHPVGAAKPVGPAQPLASPPPDAETNGLPTPAELARLRAASTSTAPLASAAPLAGDVPERASPAPEAGRLPNAAAPHAAANSRGALPENATEREAPRGQRPHEPSVPSEPSSTTAAEHPPETEISLLKRAREALVKNPGTSLALAEEHRVNYPQGRLAQEREVIAITALVRLGMPTSAERRAEQFRRVYPRSAYLGQIDRVLGVN